MKPLKIALVIWKLDFQGGSHRQFLQLAQNLKDKGHLVHLFTRVNVPNQCYPLLQKKLQIFFPNDKIKIENKLISSDSFILKLFKYLNNLFLNYNEVNKLKNLIELKNNEFKYDIFNFHDNTSNTISRFFPKNKCIWMMNDLPPLIDSYERGITSFPHSLIGKISKPFLRLIEKHNSSKFKEIIVLDKRNKSLVKKYFAREAAAIRSGLDLKSNLNFNKKHKMIEVLLTGIFQPHRRYEDLISALKMLPLKTINKINIKIVGAPNDKQYFNKIKKLIKINHLENKVILLGKVSEDKLYHLYTNANIFIFPNDKQTWGLAVFEAMLYGCATLVSRGCGASEVLKNNHNTLLFLSRNPKQLADKLIKLIDDLKLRKKIAKNGTIFVQKNLSWEKYASEMERIFIKTAKSS